MPRFVCACLCVLALGMAAPPSPPQPVASSALMLAFCQGCGCRGGSGWRSHRTGQCVGWARLARECGDPPSPTRCTKEN